MKVGNIIKDLTKNSFSIATNCLKENYCKKIIKNLEDICLKNKKKNFINNTNGQLVIRDLIFRNFEIFSKLLDIPVVMKTLAQVFKDEFILDNIIASNALLMKKNNKKNRIHMDGHLPITQFRNTTDMVAIICLNDFNKSNGSTNIWPRSHLSGIRINDKQKLLKKYKNFKSIETRAGSIIFLPGQTWHQIGKNLNGNKRWAIIIHYKLWWIKPSVNYTECGEKIFNSLNEQQKKLFGFSSIVPKIDLKTMERNNLKIKRKIESVSKNYYKAIVY